MSGDWGPGGRCRQDSHAGDWGSFRETRGVQVSNGLVMSLLLLHDQGTTPHHSPRPRLHLPFLGVWLAVAGMAGMAEQAQTGAGVLRRKCGEAGGQGMSAVVVQVSSDGGGSRASCTMDGCTSDHGGGHGPRHGRDDVIRRGS